MPSLAIKILGKSTTAPTNPANLAKLLDLIGAWNFQVTSPLGGCFPICELQPMKDNYAYGKVQEEIFNDKILTMVHQTRAGLIAK